MVVTFPHIHIMSAAAVIMCMLQWLDMWLWCRWIQSNRQNATGSETCKCCTSCNQRASRCVTDKYHRVCTENASLFQDGCNISYRNVLWHNTVAYRSIIHAYKCWISCVYTTLHNACTSRPVPVFFLLCHCHCIYNGQVCMCMVVSSYYQCWVVTRYKSNALLFGVTSQVTRYYLPEVTLRVTSYFLQ